MYMHVQLTQLCSSNSVYVMCINVQCSSSAGGGEAVPTGCVQGSDCCLACSTHVRRTDSVTVASV